VFGARLFSLYAQPALSCPFLFPCHTTSFEVHPQQWDPLILEERANPDIKSRE